MRLQANGLFLKSSEYPFGIRSVCFAFAAFCAIGLLGLGWGNLCYGEDSVARVVYKAEGKPVSTVEGRIILQDVEGGCLVEDSTGRWHVLEAEGVQSVTLSDEPFRPMTHDELGKHVVKGLPDGFRYLTTKHYVLVYNTTDAYAKWNANLYERLTRGFYKYWGGLKYELQEPVFPMVAVVFDTQQNYLDYANQESVTNADSMIGYYNMLSNRVASFDLTGIEGMIPEGRRVSSTELINTILAQPAAERTVATIVHEAVHQLAYNSGLQKRLADNPVSISEGLAMFFESPDLSNSTGWGGVNKINQYNFQLFKNTVHARPPEGIISLIQDDNRFRNPATASAAYAESWALTYFLLRTKGKEYAAYLKEAAQASPLQPHDRKRRVDDFRRHFGDDLEKLDRDFLRYLSRLR